MAARVAAKKRMAKAPKKKRIPLRADTITKCLPVGGAPGSLARWDGFNWVELLPPTVTDPAPTLKYGSNGPYWAAN